jgi:hypothetical protein
MEGSGGVGFVSARVAYGMVCNLVVGGGGRAVGIVPTVWAGFDGDGSRLPWKVR